MDPSNYTIIQKIIDMYTHSGILWKMTKSIHYGQSHLEKRQRRKEIPNDWNLTDYNNLIMNIITDNENDVHLYSLSIFEKRYFTLDNGTWIVMFGEDGFMETCMKGNPNNYFKNNPGYTYLGKVKDVIK